MNEVNVKELTACQYLDYLNIGTIQKSSEDMLGMKICPVDSLFNIIEVNSFWDW